MPLGETLIEPDPICKEDHADLVSKRRLPAPREIRSGETREGGFIVVERTPRKRLLRPAAWPVEVASLAEAYVAAKRLKRKFPDKEFVVFEAQGSV